MRRVHLDTLLFADALTDIELVLLLSVNLLNIYAKVVNVHAHRGQL